MKYSLFTGIVGAFLAIAAAAAPKELPYTPTGPLEGNPISAPSTSEGVTAGKPFKITWQPTTKGPISLILLRGPSENIKQVSYIATSQQNTGSYTWNVPATLEPDSTHYGIQLVDETDWSYQYSMQFGVANPDYKGGKGDQTPSPSAYPSPSKSTHKTTSSPAYSSPVVTPTVYTYATSSSKAWNTTMATYTTSAVETESSASTSTTGTAKASQSPFTGAAGKFTIERRFVAILAVFAIALF